MRAATGRTAEEAQNVRPISTEVMLTTPEPEPDQRRWSPLTISTAVSTAPPLTGQQATFTGQQRSTRAVDQ
jgi:hypothetical protein